MGREIVVIKKSFWILAVAALFMTGCATKSDYTLMQTEQQSETDTAVATNKVIEYRILPQDRLQIILYRNPAAAAAGESGLLGQNMSSDGVLVNGAGYIIMPLIGKVKVAGLTQTQAAEYITQRYKKYLNEPSIYLEVLNKRLYVLGEVNKPGVVQIDKEKMTLFEALAFAGDLTDDAVRDNIIIVSNDPKKGMVMRSIDLTNFDTMRYSGLMLRPNDIVYVQPSGWKIFKIKSDNYTAPLETISKIANPYIQLKYIID